MDEVRRLTGGDPTHHKIFVRGLGWDTNTNTLCSTFAEFGKLEEAIAIMDKNTGKSRGFVTYKYIDGALNALGEPSKCISPTWTDTLCRTQELTSVKTPHH